MTYKGPFYERKSPDPKVPAFIRGQKREVSQEWLDEFRRKISDTVFLIEGDEGVHIDLDGDGLPDDGWTRANIIKWLEDNGSSVGGGYKTKTKLLSLVDKVLNPPAPVVVPEPVVEEAPVEEIVEEPVEETIKEE
tara:strand:+ start:1588 stop:1992 length:405 start_codon:yes stop_codon:yes gene_type:complete